MMEHSTLHVGTSAWQFGPQTSNLSPNDVYFNPQDLTRFASQFSHVDADPWHPLQGDSTPRRPGTPSLQQRSSSGFDVRSSSGCSNQDSAYYSSGRPLASTTSPNKDVHPQFLSPTAGNSRASRQRRASRTRPRASSVSTGYSKASSRTGQPLPRCPYCWKEKEEERIPRNKSEQKKHEQTHTKPFKCDVEGCTSSGFATQNDLERHQKAKHVMLPQHGAGKYYRCIVPHCSKADKIWDRKDNFKAHVERTHKDVPKQDVDACVSRWVELTYLGMSIADAYVLGRSTLQLFLSFRNLAGQSKSIAKERVKEHVPSMAEAPWLALILSMTLSKVPTLIQLLLNTCSGTAFSKVNQIFLTIFR